MVRQLTKIDDDQEAIEEFCVICMTNYINPQKAIDGLARGHFIQDASQVKIELDKLPK
jgi:hypothetical protein